MLIGAMNHPGRQVEEEIKWMAGMGLDFVDLTLEPPSAATWNVDVRAVHYALEKHGLHCVGHTAYYLPFASPFESIRRAAIEETKRALELFSKLNVAWMNIHPDRHVPLHDQDYLIQRNLLSITELLGTARDVGVGLMIENLPGELSTVALLGRLLDPLPDLGLHLDIGHANLGVPENTTKAILARYGSRLRHAHLHDNKGGSVDLHLPLGVGNIDLAGSIGALKASGYDGTITLEVFTSDSHYLAYSRDVLRQLWDAIPPTCPANASRAAAHQSV